jgi:hypothetical protein
VKIPSSIIQGDSVTWLDAATQDNLGNTISSPNWTLDWYFSGPTTLHVTSTANGTGWSTSLTSAQTAAMTALGAPADPPNYFWQATASYGAQKITIGSGTLSVALNLANAAAGYSGQTQAEKDLANVQAAIRARISGGVIHEYWIGGRRLRYENVSELLALESRLKMIVAKQRQAQAIANGLGDPRNTYVRFQ